jgi:hypothetical protein
MLAAFGQEHREILGNLIHSRCIGRSGAELDPNLSKFGEPSYRPGQTASWNSCAGNIRSLAALPPRRAQPPRISVLEPGRRRAARRLSRLAGVVLVATVVAVGVAVFLTFG